MSQCVIAASEKDIDKSSLASELRRTHRVVTDLGRSAKPPRSRPWWGWDALQSEECRVSCKEMMRTTRKELKSKADDKHDFESIGAGRW